MYRISFDGLFPTQEGLRPNVEVSDLVRTEEKSGRLKLDLGSFTSALNYYYRALSIAGQVNVARCLQGILTSITKLFSKLGKPREYLDDYIRKQLKHVHNYFFTQINDNRGSMLLCHLHTLGGPAPYDDKQIVDDIDSWVKGKIDSFPKEWTLGKLDKIFSGTKRLHQNCALTFREYCSDVMRWATSGGAPAAYIGGEKYRTKWAWGFSRLADWKSSDPGREIYTEGLNTGGVYTVALKREPSKTREIISGPMGSHLRQSYLLYRTSGWDLPSPAFTKAPYSYYLDKQYASYCSIDGDRFDHNVPQWYVMEFVARLGFDEETRRIVELELEHLGRAELVYKKHRWKWEHGLLSGWRLTSLLGTTISHIAAQFIKERTGYYFTHIVLGDDIVMCSDIDDLDVDQCVEAYRQFGIPSNVSKSVSGVTGEFLRKLATPEGVFGYPALALKSVFYASPWLDRYDRSVQSEIAMGWWTFCSRIMAHRTSNKIIMDVIRRMKLDIWFPENEFYRWVQTPLCLGGGGTLETSEDRYWLAQLVNCGDKLDRGAYFYSLFGLGNKSDHRKYIFRKISPSNHALSLYNKNIPLRPTIPQNVNKTITIMRWYLEEEPNSFLQKAGFRFSKSIRGLSSTKLLEVLLGQGSKLTSVVSLLHVGEQLSDNLNSVMSIISAIRPTGPVSQVLADMYLYVERFLENKEVAYVTW